MKHLAYRIVLRAEKQLVRPKRAENDRCIARGGKINRNKRRSTGDLRPFDSRYRTRHGIRTHPVSGVFRGFSGREFSRPLPGGGFPRCFSGDGISSGAQRQCINPPRPVPRVYFSRLTVEFRFIHLVAWPRLGDDEPVGWRSATIALVCFSCVSRSPPRASSLIEKLGCVRQLYKPPREPTVTDLIIVGFHGLGRSERYGGGTPSERNTHVTEAKCYCRRWSPVLVLTFVDCASLFPPGLTLP